VTTKRSLPAGVVVSMFCWSRYRRVSRPTAEVPGMGGNRFRAAVTHAHKLAADFKPTL
jgi:hypothetical protein